MGVYEAVVYVSFNLLLMIFLPCGCNQEFLYIQGLGVHEVVVYVSFNSLLMKFLPC